MFIGYIAFYLYGCPILTEKGDRLVNFTTGAYLKLNLKVNVLQERLLVNKMLIVGTKLVLSNQIHLKIAEARKRYHGDMMVSQSQHARLVTEREQSMKLVEIYSLGHPIQIRQLLIREQQQQ